MKKLLAINLFIFIAVPSMALAQSVTQTIQQYQNPSSGNTGPGPTTNGTAAQYQNQTTPNIGSATQGTTYSGCPTGTSGGVNGGCNLTYTPLEPIPGVNTNNPNLPQYLNGMYKLAITVGALLAVVILTWSGIQLMTTDSISIETSAKKRIKNSLWGLVIVVGSFLIVYTLNPSALTFNFNPQAAVTGNLPTNNSVNQSNSSNSSPCGSYSNGCSANYTCGYVTSSYSLAATQVSCIPNGQLSAQQTCAEQGGAWTLAIGGNYCTLPTNNGSCAYGTYTIGVLRTYCYETIPY